MMKPARKHQEKVSVTEVTAGLIEQFRDLHPPADKPLSKNTLINEALQIAIGFKRLTDGLQVPQNSIGSKPR